ncbi:hypothetical protein N8D56_19940 [Devosia sp. A8/3-2]|nr:hypothetical protein N8D56_19940 [Devosia sp. A8/3-2]
MPEHAEIRQVQLSAARIERQNEVRANAGRLAHADGQRLAHHAPVGRSAARVRAVA